MTLQHFGALGGNAPELDRAPWKRSKRSPAFAGEVALHAKLVPHRLREPPRPNGLKHKLLTWIVGVAALISLSFVAYRLGSTEPDLRSLFAGNSDQRLSVARQFARALLRLMRNRSLVPHPHDRDLSPLLVRP